MQVRLAHGQASKVGAQATASGISAAFIGSSVMLGLALVFIVTLIIKPETATARPQTTHS